MTRGRSLLSILPIVIALVAAVPVAAATYDVEAYLNIRGASAAGLSPDGKTVAFLTNVTGSNQVWTVPASGGWPEQITFFSDRVASVAWSPKGDFIAFSKDTGGDENYQIQIVTPDGSQRLALTSNPAVRHDYGGWSRDGRLLSYASNERDRKFFDVYVMESGTWKARRVTEQNAYVQAGPFSTDGRKMIVSRQNGSLDNDLLLVDLAAPGPAKDAPLLTPHDGVASFRPLGFTADDQGVWILSDAGREFTALGRLDLATKKITWVREPKWDVNGALLSLDGKTLALVTNEDGRDSLSLLDTATGRDKTAPRIPEGQIGAMRFSGDGHLLALTSSGPARNGDVWLVDLAGGSVSQVTRSSTAGIPRASFVEPKLVRYKSFDGLEIPSWLYLPGGAAGAVPCIVAPHGGPEGQTTADFSPTIQFYLSRGFAVWAPNVRGSTGYGKTFTHLDDVRKREDSVKDLAAGVDWLKASGSIDPKRLAVLGGSYGGYMTLAAITLYPELWAAAVDSFGIADFRTFFGKTASYRVSLRASEYGDPVKDAEFLDSISPIRKVDRIRAPLLVLQGANDPRVPQAEAEQIVAAIKARNGTVDYILFPDEGHGWTKLANRITALRATGEFLEKHLAVAR
ncbi:MAG: S9 family peptidase [Acidobacteria bacterium]|nr:S9 family peptidase [Acidobacteriota bacterium]